MNSKTEYIAAIDVGTSFTVGIAGKKTNEGKMEVIALASTPSEGVKRGVVVNIEEAAAGIKRVSDQLFAEAQMGFDAVFAGIAGQHIRSFQNHCSKYIDRSENEITRDDVEDLHADMFKQKIGPGETIIHVIPQSFTVDQEPDVKNPVGMAGKKLEADYHILVGQETSVQNIEKCINRAGLELVDLIFEPLAASEAVLSEDEKEAGVALIDFGGGTTDLIVYYDGVIRHTAVIPFGGQVIATDIKEGCSILQRQAETLKVKFGSALGDLADENKVVSIPGITGRKPKEISFRNIAHIIQARMEEILDAVLLEIEKSGVADKLGAGIVITGGGAQLMHLPELINWKTGYDVRMGTPDLSQIQTEVKGLGNPRYATALGLMLKGFKNPHSGRIKPLLAKEKEPMEEEEVKPAKRGLFREWAKKISNILETPAHES